MHVAINGTLLGKTVRSGVMYTPNVGELKMLSSIVLFENIVLNLIMTNRVPVEGDVYTDYNGSFATGGDYAHKDLTNSISGSTWVVATDGSGIAVATYAEQTFTFTDHLTAIADKASCNTHSNNLVDVPNVTDLIVGDLITGTGIPTGTYITAITPTTSITISQAATATGTVTMSFAHQIWGAVMIGDSNTLYRVIKATSPWAPALNGDNYKVIPKLSLKESTT
jgi:hypothetical protein